MLTPIILLLGLAVATCIIAYVADNLGKKLGKKRVSLWGLRPRQTATLLTMASGLGIMLITLFVLLGLWGPLRHALLSYDRVRADSRELSAQNFALQGSLTRLSAQSKNLKQQVTLNRQSLFAARQQVTQANQQLNGVRQQLGVAQKSRAQAVRAEAAARRGESAARRRAEGAQERFESAQQKLARSQGRLAEVASTLDEARAGLNNTRIRLASEREKLSRTQDELKVTQKAARIAQNSVRTTLNDLKKRVDELAQQKARIADLQAREREQKANVEELSAKRDDLVRTIAAKVQEINDLERGAERAISEIVTGQLIITVQQVMAERQLPPRPSANQARAVLAELLAEGNKLAPKFGAESLELNPVPVATGAGSERTWINQQQILALLVDALTTSDVPVAVRLAAARHHFAGEKEIMARMEIIPVRTAFRAGELIAIKTIDGKEGDADIFNKLLTLVNEGEKVARERRVTPPQTPDNPHFYGPRTNERIFKALREIQDVKGLAQVRMLAAADISTVEPMSVRFEVTNSKQGA